MEFIASLRLENKLLPTRNPEISWCYVFLPAVLGYFAVLTHYLNTKPPIGSIEVLHAASFAKLVYPKHGMETIATGAQWAEGPLWLVDDNAGISFLAYSDTRLNAIYRWDQGKGFFTVGKSIMVSRSGCRTDRAHCDGLVEPGTNGLLRMNPALMPIAHEKSVDLLACQHGERAIALLRENGTRTAIATHYNGKRFNSPNDLIWSPEGHLYFTDPTYGLATKVPRPPVAAVDGDENTTRPLVPDQEQPVSGVYMVRKDDIHDAVESGEATARVYLLHGDISMPNGLGFSPDFSKLYVSNGDAADPVYYVFDVSPITGLLSNRRVFYDASALLAADGPGAGLPDGLKVDIHGNVFAAGPGGVLVLSPDGQLLGRFKFDRPATNVAFGGDGRLYVTLSDAVARIWIKTKPVRIISSHFKRKK
jgi:gluconolactonase